MAGLVAQVVDLPPASGVSEDGGKYVPASGFHRFDNFVFRRTGEAGKRPGFGSMPAVLTDGDPLPVVDRLVTRGGELVAVGSSESASPGPTAYSWSPQANAWAPRGATSGVSVRRRRPLARPSLDGLDIAPQVARIGQVEACLYVSGGIAYLRVVDVGTSTRQFEQQIYPTSKVVLLACGGVFRLVWTAITDVLTQTYDPATRTLGASSSVATLLDSPLYWDAVATTGDSWAFASVRGAGDLVEVRRFTGTTTNAYQIAASSRGVTRCALAYRFGVLLVAWDEFDGLHARTWSEPTLTSGVSPWLARPVGSYATLHALGCGIDSDARLLVVSTVTVAGFGPAFPFHQPQRSFFDAFSTTGISLGASSPFLWHVLLGSRPFDLGGQLYCLVHSRPDRGDDGDFGSDPLTRQFGYALVNCSRRRETWHPRDVPMFVDGVLAGQDGRGLDLDAIGAHLTLPLGGYVPIAAYRGGSDIHDSRSTVADVIELSTTAQDEAMQASAEVLGLSLLGGAWPALYDGAGCVEMAFLQPPGFETREPNDGPGPEFPATGANRYVYYAIFRWRDDRGHVHLSRRSAPLTVDLSAPLSGPGSGVAGSKSVTLSLQTTSLSRCHDPALALKRDVEIVIYRSKANAPDTFYELPRALPVFNNPLQPFVAITDTYTDSELTSPDLGTRPLLYTSGGVLDNELPPAARHLSVHGGRAWLVSAERNEIWFSRYLIDGEPPCWSSVNRITLDDSADEVVATAGQDGTCIALTRSQGYLVQGDGPNDTGAPPFLPPARLQMARGCRDARSVLTWRDGTAWFAQDGLVALSRKLELSLFGKPVEQSLSAVTRTGYAFYSALHDPVNDRLVFAFDEADQGRAAVYDCALGAWSTWTWDRDVVAQVIWQGQHVVSLLGAPATALDGLSYDLESSWITATLESPWLRVGALGSYLRLWRVQLTLERTGPHGLEFRLFVDGDETTPAQLEQWTPAQLDALPTWPREPLTVGVGPQKSAAFKFRLTDTAPVDSGGAGGFIYHGAALQLGAKKGLWRGPRENVR